NEQIAKRREQLLEERLERKKQKQVRKSDESDISDEDEDDEDDNIELLLAEEFAEEEEELEEEDEDEHDATDRLQTEIGEKFEADEEKIESVKLSEGSAIQPVQDLHKRIYSVLHRKYIYFFSNKQTRDKFIANPFKYLSQSKPKPVVPFKIAVLGPPKSGKSTVARRLANEYGLQRISAGEAVRTVLVTQKKTFLALQINKHLKKGLTVPDELVVQCIEVLLMDILCNTRGYVLDGYPVTRRQVELLEARNIIPFKIIELQVDLREILKRGILSRKSPYR
uniref:Uncharacterized protein n=1 Tax=Callorhinchus milii TaxID=7868 RepID=A0A4W3JUK8_CALMI